MQGQATGLGHGVSGFSPEPEGLPPLPSSLGGGSFKPGDNLRDFISNVNLLSSLQLKLVKVNLPEVHQGYFSVLFLVYEQAQAEVVQTLYKMVDMMTEQEIAMAQDRLNLPLLNRELQGLQTLMNDPEADSLQQLQTAEKLYDSVKSTILKFGGWFKENIIERIGRPLYDKFRGKPKQKQSDLTFDEKDEGRLDAVEICDEIVGVAKPFILKGAGVL